MSYLILRTHSQGIWNESIHDFIESISLSAYSEEEEDFVISGYTTWESEFEAADYLEELKEGSASRGCEMGNVRVIREIKVRI